MRGTSSCLTGWRGRRTERPQRQSPPAAGGVLGGRLTGGRGAPHHPQPGVTRPGRQGGPGACTCGSRDGVAPPPRPHHHRRRPRSRSCSALADAVRAAGSHRARPGRRQLSDPALRWAGTCTANAPRGALQMPAHGHRAHGCVRTRACAALSAQSASPSAGGCAAQPSPGPRASPPCVRFAGECRTLKSLLRLSHTLRAAWCGSQRELSEAGRVQPPQSRLRGRTLPLTCAGLRSQSRRGRACYAGSRVVRQSVRVSVRSCVCAIPVCGACGKGAHLR